MDDSEILSVDFNLEDPSLIDCSEAKDRGVLKKILKQGTGAEHPFDGSTVFVHYVGRSLDGSIFDSSRKRGDSFSFELGKRKLKSVRGEGTGLRCYCNFLLRVDKSICLQEK